MRIVGRDELAGVPPLRPVRGLMTILPDERDVLGAMNLVLSRRDSNGGLKMGEEGREGGRL